MGLSISIDNSVKIYGLIFQLKFLIVEELEASFNFLK